MSVDVVHHGEEARASLKKERERSFLTVLHKQKKTVNQNLGGSNSTEGGGDKKSRLWEATH